MFRALIDTGASASAVSLRVAQILALPGAGPTLTFIAHGTQKCDTHIIAVALPNRVIFHTVRVSALDLPPGIDMLIGMDILGWGDMAITNHAGKTVFTFRLPSCRAIDFVKEIEWAKAPKGGLCPCGSGRKAKHCHAR